MLFATPMVAAVSARIRLAIWGDRTSKGASEVYDAEELLRDAAVRHGVRFAVLVAETALWVDPDVHRRLLKENGTGAWFPAIRRGRRNHGEIRGQSRDGVTFDDNSYANQAIKRALGIPSANLKGFETCHIWPRTCYDPRYHTAIANLVLLPRALAGFTDHDSQIRAALQYRAFELYSWHPEGAECPTRPSYYPDSWRSPEPFTGEVRRALEKRRVESWAGVSPSQFPSPNGSGPDAASQSVSTKQPAASVGVEPMTAKEHAFVVGRIRQWASKPSINAHRIVGIVVRATGGIDRTTLIREAGRVTGSANPSGAITSMMTSRGNAYGRVFIDEGGVVRIHPEVAGEVAKHRWQ